MTALTLIPAAEACAERNLAPGMVIMSDRWREPRLLFRLHDLNGAQVRYVVHKATGKRSSVYYWVKRLPSDVRRVG